MLNGGGGRDFSVIKGGMKQGSKSGVDDRDKGFHFHMNL